MSAIIRRKLRETWRDAVSGRFAELAPEAAGAGLSAFDQARADGQGEAEAAFAVLSTHGLLWHVEGAGFTPFAEGQDRHSVPRV